MVTTNAERPVRVATFNASLNRSEPGALADELSEPTSVQGQRIAEIIQRIRPDILALQEFDFDPKGRALAGFKSNYLGVSQNGAEPIVFPYSYQPEVNTGLPTGLDLNNDGQTKSAADAHGFGHFEGQYGFIILSKYPIKADSIRTFQSFLWTQMPHAKLPKTAAGTNYYSPEVLKVLRLSSKNHVDAAIMVGQRKIHLLVSHPTPPVFDGPENRNGLRNHDEIQFWTDYITPTNSGYIVDDKGRRGGLQDDDEFIVLGDLNADPIDGDGINSGINRLLNHKRILKSTALGDLVPSSRGGAKQNPKVMNQKGDPAHDTASWGLRVDYVLPSKGFAVIASGVFWPESGAPHADLVGSTEPEKAPSDHRLVWIDIRPARAQVD